MPPNYNSLPLRYNDRRLPPPPDSALALVQLALDWSKHFSNASPSF
jgi:hypothetical protein